MPKVSDAHLVARRQMGASSACFVRQGFHQTTMPGGSVSLLRHCLQLSLQLVEDATEQSEDPFAVLDMIVDSGFG